LSSWITQALPGAVVYAASLLGDRHKAEDVVQECVCRLLLHAARYDLERDGRKLLYRAITNACINHATRGRRDASLDEIGRGSDDGSWELHDSNTLAPPDLAIADETRETVRRGLATLPIVHRSAIELWSLGYSTEEIADMLSLSPGNIRVIIHRAKNALEIFLRGENVREQEEE